MFSSLIFYDFLFLISQLIFNWFIYFFILFFSIPSKTSVKSYDLTVLMVVKYLTLFGDFKQWEITSDIS